MDNATQRMEAAYSALLSRDEGREKQAFIGRAVRSPGGKAVVDRLKDYGRNFRDGARTPFGFISKDRNRAHDLWENVNDRDNAGGSLGSGLVNLFSGKKSMAGNARRYEDALRMSPEDYGNLQKGRWYRNLTDEARGVLDRQRHGGATNLGGRKDFLQAEHMAPSGNIFGNKVSDRNFDELYNRYGSATPEEMAAQAWGLRGATAAGGALLTPMAYSVATNALDAPGALMALPTLEGRARQGALDGAASQLRQFQDAPFTQRMGYSLNPQSYLEDMYQNNPGAGLAHSLMYGGNSNADIKVPGLWRSALTMLNPNPLGNSSALDKYLEARSLRGLQDMGRTMGSKSASVKEAKKFRYVANMTGKAKRRAKKPKPTAAPSPTAASPVPDAVPSAASPGRVRGFYDDQIRPRLGSAGEQIKNHKTLAALGLGLPTLGTGLNLYHGWSAPRQTAYNTGYSGGQATAAHQFANQNILARAGAGMFPGMAVERILAQYPELASAYNMISRRNMPASMRNQQS